MNVTPLSNVGGDVQGGRCGMNLREGLEVAHGSGGSMLAAGCWGAGLCHRLRYQPCDDFRGTSEGQAPGFRYGPAGRVLEGETALLGSNIQNPVWLPCIFRTSLNLLHLHARLTSFLPQETL